MLLTFILNALRVVSLDFRKFQASTFSPTLHLLESMDTHDPRFTMRYLFELL